MLFRSSFGKITLYYAGSGGLVMNTISCVDLALWDLFGKVVGLPVYKLLGGAVRDEIQFYATGARFGSGFFFAAGAGLAGV